ncbi:MAG TPA: hypothetical protein VIH20_02710 [Candidatus Subteraquimicrobiales bacterium]
MRKAIKILLVLFFIPLFMAFLILINLQVTFFSSEFVKERLQESGIYKKVLDQSDLLIPIFPMEETKISDFSDLSSKKVKGLIDESVKPRDVQKMSETVIDQVHEIFSGRSSDYVVEIPLKDIKGKIEANLEEGDPILLQLEESPDKISLNLSSEAEGSPKTPLNILEIANLFTIVVGAITLGLLIVIILIAGNYVAKIRLASLSLLIPSVMVFIYSLLSSLIISRFNFSSLGGLDSAFPEEMGQVVISSFKSSVTYLFLLLRWESLALTILAALALILSYRMKPRLT